jgi:filamentous hemagglutinin family protein
MAQCVATLGPGSTRSAPMSLIARSSGALLLATTTLTSATALANPRGGVVVGGSATISQPAPNQVTITQQSNRAAINWQGFSIGQKEATTFRQPSSSSVALNRVVGGNPSTIAGHLSANGIVFLVNPNGVVFTPTAHVDVNGIIATTSDISTSDFMAGRDNFTTPGNPNASVLNEGTITTRDKGLVGLVAPWVRNDGVIQAHLGKVTLASGTAYTVDLYGDQLIQFAVPVAPAPPVASTQQGARVANTGTIAVDGGTVWLTANTASQVVNDAINTSGIIQAEGVQRQDGTIVLDGGPNGNVAVGGTLDASGRAPGEVGGTVKVLGNNVTLSSAARLDVSGDAGGGTALIGGNFHGAGPERNATSTTVADGAEINADAISTGNGGQVAVWSDDATEFDGAISARGGAQGGRGGFVETSGKQGLSVQTGKVDTEALHGATGNWLLDPEDIFVSPGGPASLSDVGSFGTNPGGLLTINPTTIGAATSNVILEATQDIDFEAPVSMQNDHVGITALAGDSIYVGDPIATRGGNITLVANDPSGPSSGSGNLYLLASLSTNSGGAAGGSLVLQVAGGSGEVFFGSDTQNITTLNGSIQISAPPNSIVMSDNQLTIDTTGGGATSVGSPISFESGVFDTSYGDQFLTLRAGNSDIFFGGNVRVGGLDIVSARNLTATGYITANKFFTDTNQTGNIYIPGGISTSGQQGATIAGNQNAGPVNISVAGNVTIGTDLNSFIIAYGGYDQSTGNGGNGADVSIRAGGTATLSGIRTQGGTPGNSSARAGNGGSISITAPTISLLGYPEITSGVNAGLVDLDLNADGGTSFNASNDRPENISGVGGNITLTGHVILRGGAGTEVNVNDTSAGAERNITINGEIDATTPYAESLQLGAGPGQITVENIGANTPLANVGIFNDVIGSLGSVTAGELSRYYSTTVLGDEFGSSTTTFNGPVNIRGNATLYGTHLNFPDGLTIGGAANFGSADLVASRLSVAGPTTIVSDTTIDTSASSGTITLASVDGAEPNAQSLTLHAATFDAITTGPVGASVPLHFQIIPAPPSPQQENLLDQYLYQTSNPASLDLAVAGSTPPTTNPLPANLSSILPTNAAATAVGLAFGNQVGSTEDVSSFVKDKQPVTWGLSPSGTQFTDTWASNFAPIDTMSFIVNGTTEVLKAYANVDPSTGLKYPNGNYPGSYSYAVDGPFQCTALVAQYLALLGLPASLSQLPPGMYVASKLGQYTQYFNNSRGPQSVMAPQVGSIVSFSDLSAPTVGHVAIIKGITSEGSDTIVATLIEDNMTVAGDPGFAVNQTLTFKKNASGDWVAGPMVYNPTGRGGDTFTVTDWVTPKATI